MYRPGVIRDCRGMTPHQTIALSPVMMAFAPAASGSDAVVPDWIHLLPVAADGAIRTDDSRGPYRAASLQSIIAASFAGADRLIIDKEHATDKLAPQGFPAPARGWIVAMEAREDGIWGQVEWTGEGRRLLADRAYRGISPVLVHDAKKVVHAIPRASLVNRPNLKGLVALNSADQENPMDKIAEALGLQAGASADDIIAAIGRKGAAGSETAMQASLQQAQGAVTALQTQVAGLTAALNAREEADRRARAEAFIDRAIADKRPGLNANTRDYFVSLHMADPQKTEAAILTIQPIGPTGMTADPPAAQTGGITSLNASDLEAARVLGIPAEKFLEARKKEKN